MIDPLNNPIVIKDVLELDAIATDTAKRIVEMAKAAVGPDCDLRVGFGAVNTLAMMYIHTLTEKLGSAQAEATARLIKGT